MIDTEDRRTLAAFAVLAFALALAALFGAAVLAVAIRLFLYLSGV